MPKMTYEEAVAFADVFVVEATMRIATMNGRDEPNADDMNAGQAASDALMIVLGYGDMID